VEDTGSKSWSVDMMTLDISALITADISAFNPPPPPPPPPPHVPVAASCGGEFGTTKAGHGGRGVDGSFKTGFRCVKWVLRGVEVAGLDSYVRLCVVTRSYFTD
jgi:hypothetical protein